ncbi:HutD family protein [Piscinibacter sakaiensis]|uniref:HutD family protein n=1 Tax=Piscinibacter sakaiensis TaxID=1547922 RepID=UPI00372CD172
MPAQPWRNGGGHTRELWTWPADGPWQARLSVADIAADGPFSAASTAAQPPVAGCSAARRAT